MAMMEVRRIVHVVASVAVLLVPVTQVQAAERRCGWIENPTPANWWFRDREAEWTLGTMGGWQVPGIDGMPDMTTAGWVETNGHYGYGCGCLVFETDRARKRITRLVSARPVPLGRCRADRRLPVP